MLLLGGYSTQIQEHVNSEAVEEEAMSFLQWQNVCEAVEVRIVL